MPARHPSYPFVEPEASGLTRLEIEVRADQNAAEWGYRRGVSLEAVCKVVGLDVEYSHHPNEILLEVPLEGRPVVWLPKKGRKREDRVAIATAIGHWTLHIEKTRTAHPGCGVQALYEPTSDAARGEAEAFGRALLMPQDQFTIAWIEGRSQAASDLFDVPTKTVYLRAESLDLREAI